MHTAIIMDGNGRWAERRGLPRTAGHRAGAKAVRRIVEAATRSTVDVLTLYAFSADNWARPAHEVSSLMRLLKRYLVSETARCLENGVRLSVIGRRDRLSRDLANTIEHTERITSEGRKLHLRLAIDYSARAAITDTLAQLDRQCSGPELEQRLTAALRPSVDLLIRTGGEQRLSDFLLWECAYAELVFVDTFWPDFDEACFDAALHEFARRDRRFGGLSANVRQSG